jgi:hypothetical protein
MLLRSSKLEAWKVLSTGTRHVLMGTEAGIMQSLLAISFTLLESMLPVEEELDELDVPPVEEEDEDEEKPPMLDEDEEEDELLPLLPDEEDDELLPLLSDNEDEEDDELLPLLPDDEDEDDELLSPSELALLLEEEPLGVELLLQLLDEESPKLSPEILHISIELPALDDDELSIGALPPETPHMSVTAVFTVEAAVVFVGAAQMELPVVEVAIKHASVAKLIGGAIVDVCAMHWAGVEVVLVDFEGAEQTSVDTC